MSNGNSSYWARQTVELRAAGFDPAAVRRRDTIVTVANPFTNAHRCNNRVQRLAELVLAELDQANAQVMYDHTGEGMRG